MNLAVVLAVSMPDFHLAVKWLRWAAVLAKDRPSRHRLIVVAAATVEDPLFARLCNLCLDLPNAGAVRVEEVYERPDLSYAAAANHLFISSLKITERSCPGCPTLFVEADTVPMRESWIDDIANEYAECGKPFMGAFHAPGPIPHMSGNAVYGPDWRVKAPSLAMLPEPRPQQGWDSKCAFETVPQMHVSRTIKQVWITPPFTEKNWEGIVGGDCALFHRTKDGTLIDVLAARRKLTIPLELPVCQPTSRMAQVDDEGTPVAKCGRQVAILIVTYAKDMDFLRYCLKSIKRHARGFAGVTLVVPSHERGLYEWVKRDAVVRYFDEPKGKGMLSHMIQKCRADEWCPNCDAILHMDPDCQFFRHVTPEAYVKNGRYVAVVEPFASIPNPNRHLWKDACEKATGIVPIFEFMVRHPQIHCRDVYKVLRETVEKHTGRPFDEYVLDGRNEFPQSFAEFTTLGAIALREMPGEYLVEVYDRSLDALDLGLNAADGWQYVYRRDRDYLVEWWSHGGMARYKSDCEAVAAGRLAQYWVK